MIGYLEGTLIAKDGNSAIINVNGVGYTVTLAGDKLTVGDTGSFFCHTIVREDDISIYAFRTQNEVSWLRFLVSASGIGPTAAMNMISNLPLSEIAKAIHEKRPEILTAVKGVGARVAEKCIVSLSGKKTPEAPSASGTDVAGQAISVLCALHGAQSRDAIVAAVKRVYEEDPSQPLNIIVRAATSLMQSQA